MEWSSGPLKKRESAEFGVGRAEWSSGGTCGGQKSCVYRAVEGREESESWRGTHVVKSCSQKRIGVRSSAGHTQCLGQSGLLNELLWSATPDDAKSPRKRKKAARRADEREGALGRKLRKPRRWIIPMFLNLFFFFCINVPLIPK